MSLPGFKRVVVVHDLPHTKIALEFLILYLKVLKRIVDSKLSRTLLQVLEEESSGDVKAVGLKELENNNNGTTNPVFDSLHAQSSSDKLSEL